MNNCIKSTKCINILKIWSFSCVWIFANLGLFVKCRIHEKMYNFDNSNAIIIKICIPREICEKLKPREYYQIYSIIMII